MLNNPFLDMSVDELEIAYDRFTYLDDVIAVEWVQEAFCSNVELEFELIIRPLGGTKPNKK